MKRAKAPSAVEQAIIAWREGHPFPDGVRCLIGVSGGRDSMALLHCLTQDGSKSFVVCHLEHGIRGEESRTDALFIQEWAKTRHLEVMVGHADVPAQAAARRLSLETAARNARQEFFMEAARIHASPGLLLAHHADDQVETILFNLCRGAGGNGLAGMSRSDEWTGGGSSLRVFRPLLGVWRREIDAYIGEHGISYREDATNTDAAHTRNRVRHEVIPTLDRVFGRDVSPNIWRAAEILAGDQAWIQDTLQDDETRVRAVDHLPCAQMRSRPVAEQRRLLRAWLRARGCLRIGYEEVEATRTLLNSTRGPAKINLAGGRHVRRRAGVLFVEVSAT